VPADLDDFAEFYQASYRRMVALVAAMTGDRCQAEDIAQEAYARALTRWPQVARYDLPEAWVRRVAIRLTVDALRRMGRAVRLSARLAAGERVGAQRGSLLTASRLVVPYGRYCPPDGGCQQGQLLTADGARILLTRTVGALGNYTNNLGEYSVRTGRRLAALAPTIHAPGAGPPCVPLWSDPSGQQVISFCGGTESATTTAGSAG